MNSLKEFLTRIVMQCNLENGLAAEDITIINEQQSASTTPQNADICGICGEEILPQITRAVTILSCKHFYHHGCITHNKTPSHRKQTTEITCPICQTNTVTTSLDKQSATNKNNRKQQQKATQ